ncbi:hypothetical protein V6Z12_D02G079600, partial [Gossypium hirsutum]
QIQQKAGIKIPEEDDIESLFSIDDEPNDQSICAIQSFGYSDSESTSKILAPHIPVSIYLEKYGRPITVIAFIDTGAAESIMNPYILPEKWWEPHTKYFSSASGKFFTTDLRSKPIKIQIFPTCSITTTVLGSKLLGKDLIFGFDLYIKAKQLRILPEGIRFKKMFKPYVPIPRLFLIDADKIQQIVEELKQKACAESHSEFLQKCNHPLWKNPSFFIKLPFKKNEDINPTKASHVGMNPVHLKLAEEECQQLQEQGLIEPSDSQWA